MGTCGQPGYVFRDFCLKQGIDFIIFCLNQGIDFISFYPKQGIFFWTINSLRVCSTNVLEFCLKQDRKISDFCLKQGQGMRGWAAPLHSRIYWVTPPPPPRLMTLWKSKIEVVSRVKCNRIGVKRIRNFKFFFWPYLWFVLLQSASKKKQIVRLQRTKCIFNYQTTKGKAP